MYYFTGMISHEYKLIFIHIPKCAGRSVSKALQQDFDHYTASFYEREQADCWSNYTVFTTVRNPYQRLVSMYHYLKNEPFHAAHPITNQGNMIPFKHWLIKNIDEFRGEFNTASAEGNRESDGDMGSPFWFSSQVSRLSNPFETVYSNIRIFKYEDGIHAVEKFLSEQTNRQLPIAHINNSNSDSRSNYFSYYDDELLTKINLFPPFVKDCTMLNYKMMV